MNQCSYGAWLEEDVGWIISDPERAAFLGLSNDEERDQFVEQFWQRRDPTPDTYENEYKEEHYRRVAYANEHFSTVVPGWKTDRGRAYIVFGPPDDISHPPAAAVNASQAEGESAPSAPPEEVWSYRYRKPPSRLGEEVLRYGPLKYADTDVILRFVDKCRCGAYQLVLSPSDKNPFSIPYPFGKPAGPEGTVIYIGVLRPPAAKFKELQELVTHSIALKQVPFEVVTDFANVTRCTSRVSIAIQINNRDITFANNGGKEQGKVSIFGRLTSLTGRVVETFEGTLAVDSSPESVPGIKGGTSVYHTEVALRPGYYRLDAVVQDANGDRAGTWHHGILVPFAK